MTTRLIDTETPVVWRNQWNSTRTGPEYEGIDFTGDPGMTLQAPAEEANINVIMKRFGVTNGSVLPHWGPGEGIYDDISEFPDDPTELANILREGELRFIMLPSDIRDRFQTPAKLWDWINDAKNHEQAVELGLLKRLEHESPPAAPPAAGT